MTWAPLSGTHSTILALPVVDVATSREELSLPPKITLEQIKGFTLYAARTVLSGRGDEIVELAKTNLRDISAE